MVSCVCLCLCCIGFESLLEASRYSELSLLFKLFMRFKDGLGLICKAFSDYIKVCVCACVARMLVCLYIVCAGQHAE